MRRLKEFAWFVGFCILVLPALVSKLGAQQPFPVLLISDAVRYRLAVDWEPLNALQHEKGYCVEYTEDFVFSWNGPLMVYRLTSITRAVEEGTTTTSIMKMTCPTSKAPWTYLHTHPPTQCESDTSCVVGGEYANQCFASGTDMRSINKSDKPFGLIQCDRFATVPVWRTAPYPPPDSTAHL